MHAPALSRGPYSAAVAEAANTRTGENTRLSGQSRLAGALSVIALVVVLFVPVSRAGAAPNQVPEKAAAAQIDPDWLSPSITVRLAVGIDVMLPEIVPAPFESEPTVEAWDGYYSLYWLIPGTPPTYLLITGEAGGTIPDYSAYDRNVQLEVNANVQGYDAYHDLTPVYDLVYWQVGNVVYSVESRNLLDTDSLTLANILALLDTSGSLPAATPSGGTGEVGSAGPSLSVADTIAAGDVASIDVTNTDGALLTASSGTFTATGSDTYEGVSDGSYEWKAPNTVEDVYVQFLLIDPDTHDWIATAEATVVGSHARPATSLDCPSPVNSGDLVSIALTGGGTLIVTASNGSFPAELPNTDFAPDANNSGRIVGTIPDGSTVELNLQAPVVANDDAVFVYANDADGVTYAECEIDVIASETAVTTPSQGDNGEGLPSEPPGGDQQGDEPDNGNGQSPTDEPVDKQPITGIPTEGPADKSGEDQGVDETPTEGKIAVEGDGTGDLGEGLAADSLKTVPAPKGTPNATASAKRSPTVAASKTSKATPTPRQISTPQATLTKAPETGPDGMVAQVIGPEGGQLSHPLGATIIIPAGALEGESTVTIVPVADTKLPVSDRVDFMPATGFDISIADAAGQPIETFAKPATLKLSFKADKWRRETTLYWIDEGKAKQVAGTELGDTSVSAPIGHLSRFVAGVPIAGDQSNTKLIFIIAAIVAIFILGVIYAVFASTRRRTLTVGPRRLPSRNRRS